MNAVEQIRHSLYEKLKELMQIQSDIEDTKKSLDKLEKDVSILYEKIDEALDK